MKTFENYNMDPREISFLEFAHLDDLVIQFDFIRDIYNIYYFYDEDWLFIQNKKNKSFYMNKIILIEFDLVYDYKDTRDFLSKMVDKYFVSKYFLMI